MTAISDLIEQRAVIERQIAEAALPLVQSAHDLLVAKPVATLAANLQPIFDALPPGESKNQISNVLIVLSAVPNVLAVEAKSMSDLLSPPVAPGSPVVGDGAAAQA
ncbi:hypothetical protein OMP43_17430 [Sphingomonas sp. CBMAI 2297]|uniref:hypothetical protein n=1 Tax=Sphingomonas sp. CBMAI 2297 TaxID=2991720 RepID=UPI002455DA47|nr:hypothetical protein [Sphingomonas sp. CBMAI 2297]MDH4745810.1 hypothetical protein [Sphingomonas sp. CBMAI 2297]